MAVVREGLGSAASSGPEKKAIEARDNGNKLVRFEEFEKAIEAYSVGLTFAANDPALAVPLLANRALALMKLERWIEVLNDCDEALAMDPQHKKALYRRGKALMCLGRYQEAAETLRELSTLQPGTDEFRAELKAAESAVAQATSGEFDFRAMLAEAVLKDTLELKLSAPLCEFTSDALRLVEGRYYQARREIKEGELLVLSKPLAFAPYTAFAQGNHQVLVERVLEAAADDEASKKLLELSGVSDKDEKVVSEEIARGVLTRRSFASSTGVGLWFAPSFFNHGEAANATRLCIADWAMIRAKSKIAIDEKVTLSYIDVTADLRGQACWLESLGIVDEVLKKRVAKWDSIDTPVLRTVKASLSGEAVPLDCLDHLEPSSGTEEESPMKEKSRYLDMLTAEGGEKWYWGQLVRWLRGEQASRRGSGEIQRSLGAALAVAELTQRHHGEGGPLLEAWADAAALLFDMPQDAASDPSHGEVMELVVDGVQQSIEFLFGEKWAEDPDLSTLVLEWATLRWYHSSAWQQLAAGGFPDADAAPATEIPAEEPLSAMD
eukprot:TRINITY_DN28069_c0_g1_i1.p1 TRINITY_DN28069_c0_g1~~TRINITY_DN28069_c0_g1_i1.p1  ORF type:complete len:564 (-),score=119.53 TRINITY_DN28069_c0_g1_i1:268-1920(-)